MTCQYTPPPIEPPSKLSLVQFDYAWKWFNFHAYQRTKIFNFMLVIFGFLAGTIAGTYDKARPLAISICFFGSVLGLIFARLDLRNQYLLILGEDVLKKLERDDFYKDFKVQNRDGDAIDGGILSRQDREDKDWANNIEKSALFKVLAFCLVSQKDVLNLCRMLHHMRGGRHRYWMRGIAHLFAIGFLAAAIFHLWVPVTKPA